MKRISTIAIAFVGLLAAFPAFAGGVGDNTRSERAREAGYEASLSAHAAQDIAAAKLEADKALAAAHDAVLQANAANAKASQSK
jgi:hypothetical protein